jgi:hypothetical protein
VTVGEGGYSVVVAPSALAQMEAALVWWKANRDKAPELLARELDAALALIEQVPQCGRRVANKRPFWSTAAAAPANEVLPRLSGSRAG